MQRKLRKEFVAALASYLATRVESIRRKAIGTASNCRCSADDSPEDCSSCCSRWDANRPITLLECGAGTGILAAHLLPLLQQQLQPLQQQLRPLHHRDTSTTLVPKQQQQQQEARSVESAVQAPTHVNIHDCGAVHSKAHSGSSSLLADRNSPRPDATDVSVFSYVASEPRTELQWCSTSLAATREGCRSAMERHSPQLVICCWMPFNVDWTAKARANCCACCRYMHRENSGRTELQQHSHSHCQVQEYILIGHAEGGLVGRP